MGDIGPWEHRYAHLLPHLSKSRQDNTVSMTVSNVFSMQSGPDPSRPLQWKIRTPFMNKDVQASSLLFCVQCVLATPAIIYSPSEGPEW